jgi:hypothetical protein
MLRSRRFLLQGILIHFTQQFELVGTIYNSYNWFSNLCMYGILESANLHVVALQLVLIHVCVIAQVILSQRRDAY